MFLEIDNGNIYYETSEDILTTNKPILFVLPGGPGGDHSIYKFHSLDLEEFCCVIYHDPRACGKSNDFDPATATMDNYISDIESLRKHLNLTKISLLGTSYSELKSKKAYLNIYGREILKTMTMCVNLCVS